MKLVSVQEMRQIEHEADQSGLTYAQMMENAGTGLAKIIHEMYAHITQKSILALVGSGNNGGDALVALADLAVLGWQTMACLLRSRTEDDPLIVRLQKQGGVIFSVGDPQGVSKLSEGLMNHQVLLDGVLGTGIGLPLKSDLGQVLSLIKEAMAAMDQPPYVVAVDCPSGVDCDSGAAAPETLSADLTVTMAAVKQGLLRFPAASLIGELRLAQIGYLDDLPSWQKLTRFVITPKWVNSVLPTRPLDAHKGTFGAALVVAGCLNYTGAALLAGQAAYRVGAGLVTLGVPESLHAALAGHFPEATWLLLPEEEGAIAAQAAQVIYNNLERVTALLIGPGFGLSEGARHFIHNIFIGPFAKNVMGYSFKANHREDKAAQTSSLPPLVIDADGLKLLTHMPDWPALLPAQAVLTPHPGEMATLTGLSTQEIQEDRISCAEHFAKKWGHVVVLKGAYTLIAEPGGRMAVIPVATPALARAGTGDVLAGLIVGLRAQGIGAFEAAAAGAWIHAQAGLLAARIIGTTSSVLAGDVLQAVPSVLAQWNQPRIANARIQPD